MKKNKEIKCPECGKSFKNLVLHHKKTHTSDKGKGYKLADLFAGIGGFHLAFHDLGVKCNFACEWDDHARKTYEHNFKKISTDLFDKNNFFEDVKDIDENDVPDFDILAAGFPCQAFSQAGYKRGFDDTRGTLFFDIARILKAKKPKAYFLENVRHLVNHNEGETFNRIKEILIDDLGYSFKAKVVKASHFGLPQHRPRVFMVGFRDFDVPENFFPEPQGINKTMSDVWGADCDKEVGYTLRVGGRSSGIEDRRNWDAYRVEGEIKKLGPEQGKEMMGLPPNFEFPVSETQTMKQLGNSVAVPAIKIVAERILETLNDFYDK